ncbi:hypothetical protein A5320_02140 [Rheinheimera sp. SA_1]|uniref:hypothetical protein n=1 Tax=Rheinheimera sp. SA_1 TaxID=1827365 RepID=UPI0007FFB1A6|nr:hypothetical protein [Rheinheimera sp. SA_1]OBP16237.1 hypothetical protein A5320_02140 [Rheinheimera sp. SA_1]
MRTQTLIILVTLVVLGGCSNAVSYHHSERNSIALEGRTTDPQQPVQGVIGVKTRTILVTPKTQKGDESLSVVSDFKLKREPSTNSSWFDTTSITSAFITGKAAVNAPSSTLAVVSGLGYGAIDDRTVKQEILMESIYRMLNKMPDDKIAENHVKALDELASNIPKKLNEKTYYIIDTTAKQITKIDTSDFVASKDNFHKVIEYSRLLNSSILSIDKMMKMRDVQFNDNGNTSIIDENMINNFNSEKERLIKERSDFFTQIGSSAVIDAASQYALSFL